MIIADLLRDLSQQNIHLWVEGDKLQFRAAKGALTSELRALLKEHKADIIKALRQPKIYPTSFAQQRLWFLYQMEPHSHAYNVPLGFELKGNLNRGALERTLNEIVRRHTALRSTFSVVENQSVQIINSYQPFTLSIVDLQPLSETERNSALPRLMDSEFTQPFDLEAGLPIRFTLVWLGEADHILLVTLHHIVSDGWSVGVFYRELTTVYQAFAEGQPSPLPELSLQYADFSMWQREWLHGERFEEQLAYWQKQLAGTLPVLELPTDRQRPRLQSFNGKEYIVSLPSTLLKPLKALSREENCTLFVTLLTAFKVLLARYTQQTDILVGIPVANRARVETETMIGFFVNTLVMRSDLSKTPPFRELLKQVRRTTLEGQSHQDLPYDKLVEVLQPERDVNRSPLVQVVFSLQNTSQAVVELRDLTFQPLDIAIESAKFDLFLALSETETGLQARLQYNTDLFDESTIARMAEHYQTLLEGIVTNPDQSISQLPWLTEAERHQLLLVWNETQTEYPKDQPIHLLFHTQVQQTPKAVALVFGETEVTYEALNVRANQLAHHLLTLGVKPGDLVGLCLDRSCEMIIAILAILKAGAAYVPLDPAYPTKRLAFMLDDTQASVLLTQQSQLEELPAYQGNVVCLDSDWPTIQRQLQTNPSNTVSSSDLAYVMYTSGSTGKPKGVEVCHRSVARLLFGVDYVRLDRHQTFLLLAPISFDASTFELWGALLHGGRCVVYPERVPTFDKLGEVIRVHKVTTLWLTASLFNAVIDENAEILAGVPQVLTGGEALSPVHIRRALERLPETQLVNGYGPTESTTFTCCYRIPRNLDQHALSIPIGRPIANTQVYILDKQLNPVPIGVSGELYVGGDGLARGYLNRSALTAEKFVRHPFSEDPEARLYKTGDLVRYRPDGNIEFIGRADHQVKIRGFRIELGEIEAVLNQHPLVRESILLVREDVPGQKYLTAYVVPVHRQTNAEELLAELQDFVRTKLPSYMVPSAIMLLEQLPLTPNGKVDRKALPVPDRKLADAGGRRWPKDELEAQLVQLWEKVIGTENIGVEDNFFDLGGHSLLGVTLLFEIQKATGEHLPLSVLFEHPTVMELASVLRRDVNQVHSQVLIPVQPKGSRPPFFDVYGFAMSIAPHLRPDQPYYCFNYFAHGHGNRLVTDYNVEEIAANHVKEMQAIQPHGPYYLGGYSFGGMVAYEMAQQLYKQGEQVALLALFDPTRPHIIQAEQSNLERKLVKLSARERLLPKLKFLGERLIARIVGKYTRSIQSLKRRYYLASGRPMPPELNRVHLMDLSRRASRVYRYLPYPGHVDLFIPESAEGFENWAHAVQRGWDELSADGATVHVVQGAKNHAQVMVEPHVQILAQLLDECLQSTGESCAAQASVSVGNG